MAQAFFGSQRVLNETQPWVVALVLYMFTIVIAWPLRKYFEGLAYNIAYSSKYGDIALIGCIFIAGLILHRYTVLPDWVTSLTFHFILGALAIGIGIGVGINAIIHTTWPESQWVDLGHNFLVVPFYLYVLGTTLPVTYLQGTATEKTLTVGFLLTWALLVYIDIRTGRLDQRSWLKLHGELL